MSRTFHTVTVTDSYVSGNVLGAGTYTVICPDDYDNDNITGEDVLLDDAITIIDLDDAARGGRAIVLDVDIRGGYLHLVLRGEGDDVTVGWWAGADWRYEGQGEWMEEERAEALLTEIVRNRDGGGWTEDDWSRESERFPILADALRAVRIEEIAAVIEAAGEWAHGTAAPTEAAVEWLGEGFTAEQADEWLDAHCFDAEAARRLADAGLTPNDAATAADGETIGHRAANGDLPGTARRLAEMAGGDTAAAALLCQAVTGESGEASPASVNGTAHRWRFRDGTIIVGPGDGYDFGIEGASDACWCGDGEGHEDDCPDADDDEIEVVLDSPAGPYVEYGGHDAEEVESEVPEGWRPSFPDQVTLSTGRFRAPLVPA